MIKTMICCFVTLYTSLAAAPQAIVFDFGGVMTHQPNREPIVSFLCSSFNLSQKDFEQLKQQKNWALQNGQSDEEFWLRYAEKNHILLPDDWVENFHSAIKEAIHVNEDMLALVERLRRKEITIALLSNIDDRLARFVRDFGFYEPFDPCLLSCEIGFEKPNPQIYQVLQEKLGVSAHEILFIDDSLENIEAAKKIGFDTILFTSQERLEKDLALRGLL